MKIMYIGRQPRHRDRLFGTGTQWNGPGDVQEVEDAAATKMLNQHPTVYARPEAQKIVAEQIAEQGEKLAEAIEEFLRTADAKALRDYALAHYGVKLDARKSRDNLADELRQIIEDID
jgi:hypothetical protein